MTKLEDPIFLLLIKVRNTTVAEGDDFLGVFLVPSSSKYSKYCLKQYGNHLFNCYIIAGWLKLLGLTLLKGKHQVLRDRQWIWETCQCWKAVVVFQSSFTNLRQVKYLPNCTQSTSNTHQISQDCSSKN